ncbi:hypothetical protein PT300_03790 [Enterobacteriaceae bacterium ESL0689]|nr:hypothetical protein [Enterobacteriaceae bacterium ESL0689]
MHLFFERWLTAVMVSRGGHFVLSFALIALVLGYFWRSSPPLLAEDDPHSRLRQQWLNVMPLKIALQSTASDEPVWQHFSPMAIPVTDVTLVAWRPAENGGELLLTVRWSAVPALFYWLARCGMQVTAFTLHSEHNILQMSVQLEQ